MLEIEHLAREIEQHYGYQPSETEIHDYIEQHYKEYLQLAMVDPFAVGGLIIALVNLILRIYQQFGGGGPRCPVCGKKAVGLLPKKAKWICPKGHKWKA